jgi:thioredoxin
VSGKVQELSERDFATKTKNKKVLIDFWAPWCHACKRIEPHLDELAKIYNDGVLFYKIDVTKNPGLSSRYGIMSLPNMIMVDKGKVKDQIIGATSKKEIEDRLKKFAK